MGIAALWSSACAPEVGRQVDEQPVMNLQGTELSGIVLQGTQAAGMYVRGFRFAGATLNGAPLTNFRLDKGELMAEQNGVTLRNTALANAHLFAEARSHTQPPQTTVVEYQITGVVAEDSMRYDPTHTGATFLYSLAQNVDNTGNWQPACPTDSDGRAAAIPIADTFDDRGTRNSSAPLFSLGCTTGAIAKCYRWGYRPWVTTFGNLMPLHWTCTRLARADYCGDGTSHTHDNTQINVWDILPPPGPIQAQGTTPPGMTFEAAWDQNGAICLSHARWDLDGSVAAAACANRLMPPGQGHAGTLCDNVSQAMMMGGGTAKLFNESAINPVVP